tara:strand:- start:271 stop:615 length:345 start_codon:yes stop_codon:yes gene_type:complete
MKTFEDLQFTAHHHVNGGVQAHLILENGIEVSVVSMKKRPVGTYTGLYGDVNEGTYELAMFDTNGDMVPLGLWDDVLGWQEESQITKLMLEAQTDGESFVNTLVKIRETENNNI